MRVRRYPIKQIAMQVYPGKFEIANNFSQLRNIARGKKYTERHVSVSGDKVIICYKFISAKT